MATEWYIRTGGKEQGPFSAAQFKSLVDLGRITPAMEVRNGRDREWEPASKIPGLVSAANAAAGSTNTKPARSAPQAAPPQSAPASLPQPTPAPASELVVPEETVPAAMPGYLWALIGGAVVFLGCLLWIALRPANGTKTVDETKAVAANEATVNTLLTSQPEPAALEATKQDAESGDTAPLVVPPKRKYTRKKKTTPTDASTTHPANDQKPGAELTVEQIVAGAEKSVALVNGKSGSGTGFVVRSGLIVTNKHVIADEMIDDLEIYFPSGDSAHRGPFHCELVYKDPEHDLAFLSVRTTAAAFPTAPAHAFRRGQEVVVIGNPGLGGQMVLQNAVSRGILSTEAVLNGHTYYQLGISINHGNSGGPVIDSTGHVIGVVISKAAQEEGLAFCIPAEQLKAALESADKLSPKETEAMTSRHRLQVVFAFVGARGADYKLAMHACLAVMEAAVDKGYTAKEAMKLIRSEISHKIAEFSRNDNGDLKLEVSKITTDTKIPADTRKKFGDLWTNYLALKSNVENPQGTLSRYSSKYHELATKHDRLVSSLELLLGVDISTEN